MRNSGDTDASLITPNKKSSGDRPGLDVAAAKAAFTRAVFLLGVPGWRPPRLSPGLDPLGIAIFATFYLECCKGARRTPLIRCATRSPFLIQRRTLFVETT